MPPKTGAQRVKDTEDRKRAAGLESIKLWLYPEDKPAVKAYAAKLTTKRARDVARAKKREGE